MPGAPMKELVEAIVKALVDNPDQVHVHAIEGEQVTEYELRVHASDLGKVIGRQGRTARAMRTILSAVGMKLRKRFMLEKRALRSDLCGFRSARILARHLGRDR